MLGPPGERSVDVASDRREVTMATTMTRPATARRSLGGERADVFVIFGITGDLAKVMTFRSLYRLEARGLLDCPIVGVAVDDWTIEQLRDRARDVDRGDGGDDRRGGVRPLRGAPLVRAGRLRRRRDVRARRRGDQGRAAHRSSTSRSRRSSSAASSRASRRPVSPRPAGWSSRSRSGTTATRPASSRTSCTSTCRSRRSTGSTTSSGRWASRRSSTSGSRTRCSSRSGTGTTSSASRSRWRRTSASRTGDTSTTRWARCATSSSTT